MKRKKLNARQSHVNLSPLALLCSRVPLVHCLSYDRVVIVCNFFNCNMLSWQRGGPCNVINIETLLKHIDKHVFSYYSFQSIYKHLRANNSYLVLNVW